MVAAQAVVAVGVVIVVDAVVIVKAMVMNDSVFLMVMTDHHLYHNYWRGF